MSLNQEKYNELLESFADSMGSMDDLVILRIMAIATVKVTDPDDPDNPLIKKLRNRGFQLIQLIHEYEWIMWDVYQEIGVDISEKLNSSLIEVQANWKKDHPDVPFYLPEITLEEDKVAKFSDGIDKLLEELTQHKEASDKIQQE